jgi:hypothetical protein
MCECGCKAKGKGLYCFWCDETNPNLRRVALACSATAQSYVEAAQAFSRAQKADALLGTGAGQRDLARAEAHRLSLGRSARQAQRQLHALAEELEPARRAEVDDFLSGGRLQPIAAAVRTDALAWLIDSDCSAASAEAAVGRFDEALTRLTSLQTADDMIGYINDRLAQLADTSAADFATTNQNQQLCIAILIITSILGTMAIVFTLLCLLALCDPVTVLQQWVQQVCGTSS